MEYYGQFLTDKTISEYFEPNYIGGCIDIGATNGVHINNTKYFEEKGWYCLCIEPNPKSYKELKTNRKNSLNVAVSNYNKDMVDFTVVNLNDDSIIENEGTISSLSIDQNLYDDHIKAGFNLTTTNIKVSVRTLDYCVENNYNHNKIDFLSIDTEGTELDVLKGFDLNRWNPKLIVVENNYNDTDIEDYLSKFNYVKDNRQGVNDFYIKQKRKKFLIGPKLGDFFHSLYTVKCLSGGLKSDVYIEENENIFSNGLENTYNDIYSVVKNQPYINDFLLYDNTITDYISLNYRDVGHLYKKNWYLIHQNIFNIINKFEDEPWLYKTENNNEFTDKVIIHCSVPRYHETYDSLLINIIKNNDCLFVSSDPMDYDGFKLKHLVGFKKCNNFSELYSIIGNCKFFIGNQSMPLALAHGLLKPHLGLLFFTDAIHYKDSFNPNYFWIDDQRNLSNNFEQINSFIQTKELVILPPPEQEITESDIIINYNKIENKVFISSKLKLNLYVILFNYNPNTKEEILIYSEFVGLDNCEVWISSRSTQLINISHFKIDIIYKEKVIIEKIIEII